MLHLSNALHTLFKNLLILSLVEMIGEIEESFLITDFWPIIMERMKTKSQTNDAQISLFS
jgi:hypothetical protein